MAFGMADDLDVRIGFLVGQQFLGGEALVDLAMTLPGDDLHVGLLRDVVRKVFVRQEDYFVTAERLDDRDPGTKTGRHASRPDTARTGADDK